MRGKRWIVFFLAVALLLSVVPQGTAAEMIRRNPSVVTGYTSGLTSIQKGQQVTITVSVRDTDFMKYEAENNLDVTKLADSFTGGTTSVNITSKDGDPLTYDIVFSNLTYSGTGKTLKFMVGYRWSEMSYETLEVTVNEAVEYVEQEPQVLISRGEIERPIRAGEELDVSVTFENLGNTALISPVASFTPSESLMLTGDSSSYRLEDIPAKSSKTVTVTVKALNTISAPAQSLNVDLKYRFNSQSSTEQGQASEKLNIPAEVKKGEKQPTLIVTRSAMNPLKANERFDLSVFIENAGEVDVENVIVNVSTDTLLLRNKHSTFVIDFIEAGDSEELVLKLKAPKELSSPAQNVNLEIRYSYDSGEEIVQATASEHLSLSSLISEPKTETEQMDSAVPNVIIRTFDYGSESVSAGSSFPLNIVFVNTGKIAIENIVATVDGGESFTIDGGTNTFYYDRLGAGAEAQQLIPMQVLATAKTGAQSMNISFKYEYVDGKKRAASSADIKLSIPVFQPERFQIEDPVLPEMIYAWEETTLSLNYVNKGKGEISNVEATIEGNVEALTPSQFLGNFEPGKSGTINFIFTPTEPGTAEILLKISYEDTSQQVHTREFPVTLTVEEAFVPDYPMEDIPMEDTTEKKDLKWIFIAAGVVLLIVLLIVIRVIRKKKAKKKQAAQWNEWDASWDDDAAAEPEPADTAEISAQEEEASAGTEDES